MSFENNKLEASAAPLMERPSKTLQMVRAIQICERLKDGYRADDVQFVFEQLEHVARYTRGADELEAVALPPRRLADTELEHGDVWEALAHAVIRLDSTDKMAAVLKAVNDARAILQQRHKAELAALQAPRTPETIIDRIIREVAELPDRSSPEDWPEAMLVTSDELRSILTDALPSPPQVDPLGAPRQDEK